MPLRRIEQNVIVARLPTLQGVRADVVPVAEPVLQFQQEIEFVLVHDIDYFGPCVQIVNRVLC